MIVNDIILMARENVGVNPETESSARFCIYYAITAYDDGDLTLARRWGLRSLAYSLGVGHALYGKASGQF